MISMKDVVMIYQDYGKLVRLAGRLARLGEGAPWVFHLMPQVFASIAYVLRQNHTFLLNENLPFQRMIKQIKTLQHACPPRSWTLAT